MSNVVILPDGENPLKNIEPSKAEMIEKVFIPFTRQLKDFEEEFNNILQAKESDGVSRHLVNLAKKLRLKMVKVRTGADKVRKAQKAEYLAAGRAIDGVANIVKWAVSDKEAKLIEIEKYFINLEIERLEKLQNERVDLISPYLLDASERDFKAMDNDVWDAYFKQKKQAYEEQKAAEKAAELERIERERLDLLENNREKEFAKYSFLTDEQHDFRTMPESEYKVLIEKMENHKARYLQEKAKAEAERKEAIERQQALEAKMKAEKARFEAEKAAIEAEKERLAAIEAERVAAEKAKLEAQIAAEKAEKERLEKQIEAKVAAEKAEAERLEQKRLYDIEAAAQKDDEAKKSDLIRDIDVICQKYQFKSSANRAAFDRVTTLLKEAKALLK